MKKLITLAALAFAGCGLADEYPHTYEEKIEYKILRIQNGIKNPEDSIPMDMAVSVVAREHSEKMSDRNDLSHDGFPDERDWTYKRLFPDYPPIFTLAENVARLSYFSQDYETVAMEAMKAWMASPAHRVNIENVSYRKTGIGVYIDERHIWITQLWFQGGL